MLVSVSTRMTKNDIGCGGIKEAPKRPVLLLSSHFATSEKSQVQQGLLLWLSQARSLGCGVNRESGQGQWESPSSAHARRQSVTKHLATLRESTLLPLCTRACVNFLRRISEHWAELTLNECVVYVVCLVRCCVSCCGVSCLCAACVVCFLTVAFSLLLFSFFFVVLIMWHHPIWAGALPVQEQRKWRMRSNQVSKTATTGLTSKNVVFIPPCYRLHGLILKIAVWYDEGLFTWNTFKNCRSIPWRTLYLNSFRKKLAGRYSCTAQTSAALDTPALQSVTTFDCLWKMLTRSELPDLPSNVSTEACKLWHCKCASHGCTDKKTYCRTSLKTFPEFGPASCWRVVPHGKVVFLDVGRCRSKNKCFYF